MRSVLFVFQFVQVFQLLFHFLVKEKPRKKWRRGRPNPKLVEKGGEKGEKKRVG